MSNPPGWDKRKVNPLGWNKHLSIEDLIESGEVLGLELLDTVYIVAKHKYRWRCKKIGHEFLATAGKVRSGQGCIRCSRLLDIEDMHNLAKSRGFRFLDTKYRGTAFKHLWACPQGHEFLSRPCSVKNGDGCLRCYNLRRRKLSPECKKLSRHLRSRLSGIVSGKRKCGSAVRDLGCSIQELKTHLESRFRPGMSWSNYGKGGWVVDHIKPLAIFDLCDRDQLLKACHYTNLQPLWWQENAAKGDRV